MKNAWAGQSPVKDLPSCREISRRSWTTSATVTAASSSLRERAPSIRNCWNVLCTRSSRKRASIPWNPFTKLSGVICRWALSIRSGRSRPGFNWHARRRIITSSGCSMSLPRRRRLSFALRSSSLLPYLSGRRTALRSYSDRNGSAAMASVSLFSNSGRCAGVQMSRTMTCIRAKAIAE